MRKWALFATGVFALAASSAFAQDVRYNFAKDVDFSKYKTYRWVRIQNAEQIDDITAGDITSAINAGLATKGLTRVDTDNADLDLGYQTAISSEKQLNSFSSGWGYGPGWYGGGWYGYGGMTSATTTTTVNTIYTGSLDLDMYDPAAKALVWRGVVSKTLKMHKNPEKRQKDINKSVKKLLEKYPPPVKK